MSTSSLRCLVLELRARRAPLPPLTNGLWLCVSKGSIVLSDSSGKLATLPEERLGEVLQLLRLEAAHHGATRELITGEGFGPLEVYDQLYRDELLGRQKFGLEELKRVVKGGL